MPPYCSHARMSRMGSSRVADWLASSQPDDWCMRALSALGNFWIVPQAGAESSLDLYDAIHPARRARRVAEIVLVAQRIFSSGGPCGLHAVPHTPLWLAILCTNWTNSWRHDTIGSMSASDAAPLPRLGEVFFDVRGSSRSMRLSWYADTGVAVFSIWQGGTCTGTFRLPMDDLPRLIDSLRRGSQGAVRSPDPAEVPGTGARDRLALGAAPAAGGPEPFTGAISRFGYATDQTGANATQIMSSNGGGYGGGETAYLDDYRGRREQAGYGQDYDQGAQGYGDPSPSYSGPVADYPTTYDGQAVYQPQGGYADQGYPDQGYGDQGYADRGQGGYQEQGYPEQGYADQGYPDQGYQEQGYPEQGYADQGYGGQGYAAEAYQDQGYQQPYDGQGYEDPGAYREPSYAGADPLSAPVTQQVPGGERFPLAYREEPAYPEQQSYRDDRSYRDEQPYGDPGYRGNGSYRPEPSYRDQSYGDQGYGDQGYGDQGYGDQGGYQQGGYPEQPQGGQYYGTDGYPADYRGGSGAYPQADRGYPARRGDEAPRRGYPEDGYGEPNRPAGRYGYQDQRQIPENREQGYPRRR